MMNRRKWRPIAPVILLFGARMLWSAAANAQPREIDAAKSSMTVHVEKTGVLSAFGHEHVIAAPIASGSVDATAHKVQIRVNAGALKVRDTKGSEKDKAEIQSTMTGPEVLDVKSYPEITFRSTSAEQAGAGSWTVKGDLTLHGQTRPVRVTVKEADGRYTGSALLKQTDFGITPVKVAGGTVKVKDEVKIEFEIELAR
jgi:polyisoprenoid-binding protein YceI